MSAETLTEEGSGPRSAYSVVRVHVRCCNWLSELCRNCVRSPPKPPTNTGVYGFTSRSILGREGVESIALRSVSVSLGERRRSRFPSVPDRPLQHLSVFRINNLRAVAG